jgi:hypothetical protein
MLGSIIDQNSVAMRWRGDTTSFLGELVKVKKTGGKGMP